MRQVLFLACSRQGDTRAHRTTPDDTERHVEPDLLRGRSSLRIRRPRGRGSSSLPSRTADDLRRRVGPILLASWKTCGSRVARPHRFIAVDVLSLPRGRTVHPVAIFLSSSSRRTRRSTFADDGLWKRLAELEYLRHAVGGHAGPRVSAPLFELIRGHRLARLEHHERLEHRVARPVRQPDHTDLRYFRVAVQNILDLGRVDVGSRRP